MDIVARLLAILCECWENGPCCDPVLESESQDIQQRLMEDAGVGLERLLEGEVARYGRVNAQRHCADGRV